MGTDLYNKYNKEDTLTINIELNKNCFFPGECISGKIILFPRIESIDILMNIPNLNISLMQLQYYSYSRGSGKHRHTVREHEDINLINSSLNIKDFVTPDYLGGFSIPFSVQIPINAYPSIYEDSSVYVKHFLTIELPQVKSKRTKMIFIKNIFPNNLEGNLLRQSINENYEFKKHSFLVSKGLYLINIKLIKNYFFYNEQIPFEINIDASNLDLEIKGVNIYLIRRRSMNNLKDHSEAKSMSEDKINEKNLIWEKGLRNNFISDFINFPTSSDYNSVYPPNVYQSLDQHGSFEVNEPKFNYKIYPCSYQGLVSIDYFIKFKICLDSSLTSDERLYIPIYFASKPENNTTNLSANSRGISYPIPSYSYYNNFNNLPTK